ncbi:hypothetical protein CASFOL_008102 [Castilleja foliolosa]|uniref:FAS1 domain-containing protein n=1 Tax=Castilleja foliolosa TaxID=1961234 RepID=A0ABD3E202_9LAMI
MRFIYQTRTILFSITTEMAAPPQYSLIFLLSLATSLSHLLLVAPSPSSTVNITRILEKTGQHNLFIRLLTASKADLQINNQVNNHDDSYEGLTIFAPTDNAFNNLLAGALKRLTTQQHVQLVLYHICPKFYSLQDFQTVNNPVRTQASGIDNRVFGIFFSGKANQVNVSTGIVDTPIYNALRDDFPLAVYQVGSVLLPREFYHEVAPPPARRRRSGGGAIGTGPTTSENGGPAYAPLTGNTVGNGGLAAEAPLTGNHEGNGGSVAGPSPDNGIRRVGGGDVVAPATGNSAGNGGEKMSVGLGYVAGFWMLYMGLLTSLV